MVSVGPRKWGYHCPAGLGPLKELMSELGIGMGDVVSPVDPTLKYPDASSQFHSHPQAELPHKGREMGNQNFLLAFPRPPAELH